VSLVAVIFVKYVFLDKICTFMPDIEINLKYNYVVMKYIFVLVSYQTSCGRKICFRSGIINGIFLDCM